MELRHDTRTVYLVTTDKRAGAITTWQASVPWPVAQRQSRMVSVPNPEAGGEGGGSDGGSVVAPAPEVPPPPAVVTCLDAAISAALLYCWGLDEASGNRLDHVASLPLIGTVGAGVPGKNGLALAFAGSDQMTAVMPAGLFDTHPAGCTLSCWFRLESYNGTNQMLVCKGASSSAGQYDYLIEIAHSPPRLVLAFGGGAGGVIESSYPLALDTWYLLIVTYGVGAPTSYLYTEAGLVEATSSGGAPQANASPANFRLGAHGGSVGEAFFGRIDSVIIWQRVLSSADRAFVWNNGVGL